ncbi:MAG: DCL family protein [Microbacterium sp.]|nr:DCL family protein [Microbacterium sp.]
MVAIPVTFETFSWPTIGKATEEFKTLLNDSGYDIGDKIDNPAHVLLLTEALDRHPDSQDKIGVGIDYFYVGKTSQDKSAFVREDARGFWIRRKDGSTEDFSYQTCIKGRSAKNDAKDAMRQAVLGARLAYREGRYAGGATVTSFLSGMPIAKASDAQTIYVSPEWGQLTYRFAESQGGWDKIDVDPGSAQAGGRFADPVVEQAWLDFHRDHANLQLATASEAAQRTRSAETGWKP